MTIPGLAVVAILAQLCFAAGLLRYFRQARVTWITAFAGLHLVLVGIPFALLTCHVTGAFNIWDYFRPNYEARYLLPFGDGVRPMGYLLLVQLAFAFAAILTHLLLSRRRGRPAAVLCDSSSPADANRISRFFCAALLLFSLALTYKVVRMLWLDDLPLLIALRDQIHPKAASMLNSVRKDVPYLLLPSIDRQVFLIALPFAAVMFGLLWERTASRLNGWLFAASLAASFFFLLAHLKRTPFLLVAAYFLTFAAIYGVRRYRALAAAGTAFALFGLFGMTSVYQIFNDYHMAEGTTASDDSTEHSVFGSKVATAVSGRILVGEAVEDFVAVEHIGKSLPHTGTTYVVNYLQRVAGGRAETLAEFWYRQVTGFDNGGSASTGLCLEAFAACGIPAAVLAAAVAGALLAALDRTALFTRAWEYHPVIAALVVTVGAMSVKGFFSQFFTGGTLLLLLMAGSLYILHRLPRPSFGPAASRAPVPSASGQFQ